MNDPMQLNIVRLNEGEPIIQADPDCWDNKFTLNPTAIYLKRSEDNDRIIAGLLDDYSIDDPVLQDGIVAIYYRGVPQDVPGLPKCRSSIGLAVFTPELKLLRRFPYPVLEPTSDPMGYDYNGTEDQRITRIGDMFYLVYCGWVSLPHNSCKMSVCMAESKDMINWKKLGPVAGDINRWPNKDAVLLNEPVDGRYFMFHRPCVGAQSDFSVSLAVSDSPTGVWTDCGTVMKPLCHPRYTESWIGMGSTPLSVGNGIFIADYHTGNYLETGERDYYGNYVVLDFNNFDMNNPEAVVKYRYEAVLFPETQYELNSPWPHTKNLNCIFPCGSYEFEGDIYTIYGGADAYVLAAKINKLDLLEQMEFIGQYGQSHKWAHPLLCDLPLINR
ncbi:MAG: glycoside hydrolase family 130 protein [Armatimonadota bacterium]